MPPFQHSTQLGSFPAIQPNVPAFFFGSQSGPSTAMQVTSVAANGSTATVGVQVIEGNIPVVGQLVTITGTSVNAAFNVTDAVITAVSIDAITGIGTIQFALAQTVSTTPDAGRTFSPPLLSGEAPVNGNSVAFVLQTLAGQDITWDFFITGTALSTCTLTLQGSMDPDFTNPAAIDLTNLASGQSQLRSITNKQIPFLRMSLSNVTGGDGTTKIVCRLYVRYRGASS